MEVAILDVYRASTVPRRESASYYSGRHADVFGYMQANYQIKKHISVDSQEVAHRH
jgi:hypothetical protein